MKQETVRPVDAFIVLHLATASTTTISYARLASETGVAASAAHASVKRLCRAGLMDVIDSVLTVHRPALTDFVIYGMRYCFPAERLPMRRGVPTGLHSLADTGDLLVDDSSLHVWPDPEGSVSGNGLVPLHRSVPRIVSGHPRLHEVLALFDLLRIGAARERTFAMERLHVRLGARG